jgi:hypothetical protein
MSNPTNKTEAQAELAAAQKLMADIATAVQAKRAELATLIGNTGPVGADLDAELAAVVNGTSAGPQVAEVKKQLARLAEIEQQARRKLGDAHIQIQKFDNADRMAAAAPIEAKIIQQLESMRTDIDQLIQVGGLNQAGPHHWRYGGPLAVFVDAFEATMNGVQRARKKGWLL